MFIRLGLEVVAYVLHLVARDPALVLSVRAMVGFCLGVSSAAMAIRRYDALFAGDVRGRWDDLAYGNPASWPQPPAEGLFLMM